jgi:hypothetical protein
VHRPRFAPLNIHHFYEVRQTPGDSCALEVYRPDTGESVYGVFLLRSEAQHAADVLNAAYELGIDDGADLPNSVKGEVLE